MRRLFCSTAVLAVLFHFLGGPAQAQDILLKARTGNLEIEGTLLGYDREIYRIDTAFGPLTVDATSVECLGPGCPDLGAYVPELVIVGDPAAGNRLLAPLLEAYAARLGVVAKRRIVSDTEFALDLVPRGGGSALARFVFALSGAESPKESLQDGLADMAVTVGKAPAGERLRGRLLALDALVATGRQENSDLPESVADLDVSEGAYALRSAVDAPVALGTDCGRRLEPDAFSVRAGDYPLTRPVILTAPGGRRLPEAVRAFLKWTEGPEAGRLIRRLGYVDLLADPQPVAVQGDRLLSALRQSGPDVSIGNLNDIAEAMFGSARLSVTVRFEPGSVQPDLTSQSHISRLARDLEAGLYDGRALIFAGFSDGEGPGEPNRRISARRASMVMEQVLSQARLADRERFTVRAEGFGEALPMACDDTDWGRRVNRRVEVWVVPGHR